LNETVTNYSPQRTIDGTDDGTEPGRQPGQVLGLVLGVVLLISTSGCEKSTVSTTDEAPATFMGSSACADCHAEQHRLWSDSHHAMAMAEASPTTVLGDFSDARFSLHGFETGFSTGEDRFVVTTEGEAGVDSFPVRYIFGVEPLQQYLLGLPGGRLQALAIAWDTRDVASGGQRWFHLNPEDPLAPDDPLHWTGLAYNWNSNCADCHSIGVTKGFSAEDDAYQTDFIELSVGCEACHGPGSSHVQRPEQPYGPVLDTTVSQVEVCAPCHSRRSQLAEGFQAGKRYLDFYRPAFLQAPLYHADGQILDEVYVYGSFLQSRMYSRGVRCTDCHDPHRAALRLEGDAVCLQCHTVAGNPRFPTLDRRRYDDPAHHHHDPESSGARCVNCHMAERTYMGVDGRRDHSFRIPRPDLSEVLGVPNACGGCHANRSAAVLAEQVRAWGMENQAAPDRAKVLGQVRLGRMDVESLAAQLARDPDQPALFRATLLAEFGNYRRGYSSDAIRAGLRDPEPLVRLGALASIGRLESAASRTVLLELLDDPLRAIRIEAGRAAAGLLREPLRLETRHRIEAALEEYLQSQRLHADRPEALTNIAIVELARGDAGAAEAAYRAALMRQSRWVPARVNLADLLRSTGREREANRLLQEGRVLVPDSAELAFAYALALVRSGRHDTALVQFEAATTAAPAVPRYRYAWALALNDTQQSHAAVEVLRDGLRVFPDHPEMLLAMATIQRDLGRLAEARQAAQRLVELYPYDDRYRGLLTDLSR
jgi:predicted CXXCH cytochrome family protein